MVRALVTHLLLREQETVLQDLVADLEHLGRARRAVDVNVHRGGAVPAQPDSGGGYRPPCPLPGYHGAVAVATR